VQPLWLKKINLRINEISQDSFCYSVAEQSLKCVFAKEHKNKCNSEAAHEYTYVHTVLIYILYILGTISSD
jgi:hypothetical protein